MATYTWNTSSGSFSTASNWSPAVVPSTSDTATFSTNSGTISGTGAVGTLNVAGGGPWVFSGNTTANFFTDNSLTTGLTGIWTLTGTTAAGNYIIIANGANTAGSLTVSGGGKILSTQSGNTTSFSLYVGGTTASTGAVGSLTVTGAGSTVNLTPNGASIGQTGTGTLTVTAGATAVFASVDSTQISALAVGRAGTGTVNVTAGSTVTATGYVYIGRQGSATLTVDGGSTFTGGSAATSTVGANNVVIGDGTATLNASGVANSPLYFGGSGTARITNSSVLHSLAALDVGYRGSTGTLIVDSGSSMVADTTITVGGSTDRTGAKGTVIVQGGSLLQATAAAINNAAMVIGSDTGTTGTVTVTGSGSRLTTSNYRLTVGSQGSGSLTIANGATASSGANYADAEAALAVGAGVGGTGSLTITGAGSTLTASGDAVFGGVEKNGGTYTVGGTATVAVTGGGTLAVTGRLTIDAGASLTVDQSSTLTAPTVSIAGGTADLYTLQSGNAVAFAGAGTLKVHAVSGANSVSTFGFGDTIDFVGTTAVALTGNTVTGGGGSITLNAPAANTSYQLVSDGAGGTLVALTPQTIGVYRFFDTSLGTHFYTSDAGEAATVLATRPDLTPEGPGGIGLQAVAVAASDPNAVPVFRFFDTIHGTHFFTASASERDSVIAARPDLTYEPTSSFYEHATAQPGDTPVYRFFDSLYGTHFYTDSETERAGIVANRPDLVAEGVGFYEPHQNYST